MAVVLALVVAVVAGGLAAGTAMIVGVDVVHVAGAPITLWAALAAFGINWVAFVPAAIGRSERFYDLTGSLTFLTVVGMALAAAIDAHDLAARELVAAVLVVVWALRLGSFLVRRVRRAGKDGRFDEMKTRPARFFVAWTLQALWAFLTSLAAVVQVSSTTQRPISAVAVAGWTLWLAGFVLEVVADRQKAAFAADPDQRGRFIDRGLWSRSRHPNYLGEMLLWLGLFVSGVDVYRGGQWLAALSPLFVVVLLARVSGIPLLEKRADERWGNDPAYQAYKKRTPVLLPRLW